MREDRADHVAVIENECRHEWIDEPLGFRPERRVQCRAPTPSSQPAIGTDQPTVACHLTNLRAAETVMCHRSGSPNGTPHGLRGSADHLPGKSAVKPAIGRSLRCSNDALRREVGVRCVVLMNCLDSNAIRCRCRRLRERLPEGVVCGVAHADPIDRAEHDRLCGAKDHDAAATQLEICRACRRSVGHGHAHGRRGIDVENAQPQLLGLGTSNRWRNDPKT